MFKNHSLIYKQIYLSGGNLVLKIGISLWCLDESKLEAFENVSTEELMTIATIKIIVFKSIVFFSWWQRSNLFFLALFCNSWGCPKGKTVGRQTISFLVVVESNPAFTLIWWYGALPLYRTMWPKCWKSIFGKYT